jgi:adenosylhomocysteine nucleosidase
MSERPIGLMTAIPEEIEDFSAELLPGGEMIAGALFRRGTIEGRPVVAVESGIGKVHAAIVATLLLHAFDCRAIVFSGVAGGLDPALGVGDVVVADRLVAHDYGALLDVGIRPYQPGVPPLPGFPDAFGYPMALDVLDRLRPALAGIALPPLSARATGEGARVPRLVFGAVLTGDTFVNSGHARERLFRDHAGAAAVEMEGAAIAAVAEKFGRPAVVIRALSDLAGETSHIDFAAFLPEAARIAATVVRRVVAAL